MFEAYTFNQHGRRASPTAHRIGYHTILMEKNTRKKHQYIQKQLSSVVSSPVSSS